MKPVLRIGYVAVLAGALVLTAIYSANAQGISSPTKVNTMSHAERFTARFPDEAELAQPTQIELDLPPRGLRAIDVCGTTENESEDDAGNQLVGSGRQVGCGEASVLSAEGTHRVIEFYPLNTGRVHVAITVVYADMHFAEQTYDLKVKPSSKSLKHFYLTPLGAVPIVLGCGNDQASLTPEVYYQTLQYPLYLHNVEQIRLSVDQPEDDPVIRVDSTGIIHGLRPGKAVLTGNFDGVADHVTVDVYSNEGRPVGFTCGELHSSTDRRGNDNSHRWAAM